MLTIRLARAGKKHQPDYRIVVTEHYLSVRGKYVQKLGNYNPKTKKIILDQEKALEWMNKGAKPSNIVAKLMTKLEMKHALIVIKTFKAKPKRKEPLAESSIKDLDSGLGKQEKENGDQKNEIKDEKEEIKKIDEKTEEINADANREENNNQKKQKE